MESTSNFSNNKWKVLKELKGKMRVGVDRLLWNLCVGELAKVMGDESIKSEYLNEESAFYEAQKISNNKIDLAISSTDIAGLLISLTRYIYEIDYDLATYLTAKLRLNGEFLGSMSEECNEMFDNLFLKVEDNPKPFIPGFEEYVMEISYRVNEIITAIIDNKPLVKESTRDMILECSVLDYMHGNIEDSEVMVKLW